MAGPPSAALTRLLLHRNFMQQMARLNAILPRVGLAEVTLTGPQQIEFDAVVVHRQGSGLRSLLPILAAITDRGLVALLIDEPEVSLEPRLQKALRDLLVEATNDSRSIVVATHSHLFINRQVVESTQIVGRTEGRTTVETVSSREELYDLTFDMLGSSTEDLFFRGTTSSSRALPTKRSSRRCLSFSTFRRRRSKCSRPAASTPSAMRSRVSYGRSSRWS